MHKTGGFLHIQRILKRDTKRARRDKECAPQQRATIQQNVIIVFAVIAKYLLERSFPAHSVYEGHFYASQGNVRRKNIHAFLMMKDTLPRRKWRIV